MASSTPNDANNEAVRGLGASLRLSIAVHPCAEPEMSEGRQDASNERPGPSTLLCAVLALRSRSETKCVGSNGLWAKRAGSRCFMGIASPWHKILLGCIGSIHGDRLRMAVGEALSCCITNSWRATNNTYTIKKPLPPSSRLIGCARASLLPLVTRPVEYLRKRRRMSPL